MATNQESIVSAIVTKLTLVGGGNYNRAIMELAANYGFSATNFNSGFQQFLSVYTGSTKTNLPDLISEYASLFFDGNISSITDYTKGLPESISGIVLWLDANDASTVIDSTTPGLAEQWDDRSAEGDDATATGAARPATGTTTINSLNVLDYDGTSDFMSISGINSLFSTSAAFSIFIVFKLDVDDATDKVLFASTVDSTDRFVISRDGDQTLICSTYDGAFAGSVTPFTDTTSAHIVGMTHTTGDVIDAYLDGTQMPNTTVNPITSNTAATIIGSRTSAADVFFNGPIAEIIVYNKVLSFTEQFAVQDYLGNKWGISVPAFAPTSLVGNILWLDANDESTITKDGSNNVTAVSDKSAQGNNSTGTCTYDATGFSGLPTLIFDGSSDNLSLGKQLIATGDDYDMFVVAQNADVTQVDSYILAQWTVVADRTAFLFHGDNGKIDAFNQDDGAQPTGTTVMVNGTSYILGSSYDQANMRTSINGTDEGIAATVAMEVAVLDFFIGSSTVPSRYWGGNISEIVIYNRKLAAAERSEIITYLSNKWGITI